MRKRPLSAVVAYRTVLDEVKAQENKAIDQGKWPLHAYYADMVDALERAYVKREQWDQDGGNPNPPVIRAMRRVLTEPHRHLENGFCYRTNHYRYQRAQEAAIQVYATKVLRLAGETVPHRSLEPLRAQKRWPDPIEGGGTRDGPRSVQPDGRLLARA